jgi:hypothetical protein
LRVSANGLTMNRLTLSNGDSFDNGGGLLNDGGVVNVVDTLFTGNESHAGTLFNNRGLVTIAGSSFTNNTAGMGAGLFNLSGAVRIERSVFENNDALAAVLCGRWTVMSVSDTAALPTIPGWKKLVPFS